MFFISYDQQEENKKQDGVRKYYPVPPVLSVEYQYQNINKDPKLRTQVTLHFQEKMIDWIKHDKDFRKFKSKLNFIKSNEGKYYIYDLLRYFVKRTQLNWYDLRERSDLVKEFIVKKF